MPKYMIISRFPDGDLSDLDARNQKVKQALKDNVPSLNNKWSLKLAAIGTGVQVFDVVDSPSAIDAMKAAALIEKHGRCKTEVLPAVEWQEFVSAQAAIK